MDARTILDALAVRHERDVFVPECKTGPTWSGRVARLDAWAMVRSWAHWKTFGYEIKVTRADFLRDKKWTEYLWTCHEFYFVAPAGVIDPAELPPEAGLLVATANGARVLMKKKAAARQIEAPANLLIYILMTRSEITRSNLLEQGRPSVDYWRRWLRERAERQEVGYLVAAKIRERVHELDSANYFLSRKINEYEAIKDRLRELGFDPGSSVSSWTVGRRLEELRDGVPKGLRRELEVGRDDLSRILRVLDRIEGRSETQPQEEELCGESTI